MLRSLFILLIMNFFLTDPVCANNVIYVCDPTADRQALIDLYNATNGDNWTVSWDINAATSSWEGVTTNAEGCVTHLVLRNNNLTGSLPNEIGDLSELLTLDLSANNIGGNIPTTIGNLSQLEVLFLWNNPLIGSIPTSISNLSNLHDLRLFNNQLTGGIPSTIGDLSNLSNLQIYNIPTMSGTLPSELGDLTNLTTLRLFNIGQMGNIPTELGNLTQLTFLQLLQNNFTGSIPATLGNLTELTHLDIGGNMLTGTIPATLGNLIKLEVLDLASNQLNGEIPPALSDLDVLRNLYLSNNNLTGNIPAYLGDLAQLEDLRLQNNDLTGEMPIELIELNNTLTNINLSNNNLEGCLPSDFTVFCNNTNLTVTLTNNPNLSNDDFTNFCSTGTGGCVPNDECDANIPTLPMNIDPCGRDSRTVILNGASVSDSGPTATCSNSFATVNGADVWFKVTVPATKNFLIKSDSLSNINLFAEAYTDCPNGTNALNCQSLSQYPHVMEIADAMAGTDIYFRLWDSLNLNSQAGALAQVEISAHELPANKDDWQLCDFSNALPSSNSNSGGQGTRKALEFIAQYEDAQMATVARDNLLAAGAKQLKSCDCNGEFLEVWQANSIIELENIKQGASMDGNVDTTNYNYIIRTIPLVDTLGEQRVAALTFGDQRDSDLAMDAAGNFVVVWRALGRDGDTGQEANIYARLFDKDGIPRSQEFRVNNDTSGDEGKPSVAMRANGEFVIVWIGTDSNFSPYEQVLFSRYDATGNILTDDKLIASNNGIGSMITSPNIAINAQGTYAITWYDKNDYSVQVLLADNDDNIIRTHTVNSTSFGYYLPQIDIADNGHYAVTAGSFIKPNFPPTGSDELNVVAQLYKATGDPIGTNDFLGANNVNSTTTGAQINPQIIMDAAGNFIIAWTDVQSGDNGNVMLRRYDANGNALSDEVLVNSTTSNQQLLNDISRDDAGDYIVTWQSELQDGDKGGIYSKYFAANGDNFGGEFRVNIKPTQNQFDSRVALNDVGNVTYVYNEFYLDDNLLARRFFSPTSEQPLTDLIPIGQQVINGIKPDYATNNYNPINNTEGSVTVAVLDSGIKLDNTRFENAKWTFTDGANCVENENGQHGYDFNEADGIPNDTDGHGTALNGVIVDDFPSDLQLELMNLKFYTADTSTLFDAVCGIYYAIENGADIINLSWGFESVEQPAILRHALIAAEAADVLVVTSAGNEAKDNSDVQKYPANYSGQLTNLITVTAYDEVADTGERSLSPYANFSDQNVDIAALGTRLTTGLNDDLVCLSGTSLATPAVTRVAAMMKAQYGLSAAQIKNCILDNVTPVAILDGKVKSGGILNEAAAMQCAAANALPIEWLEFVAFAEAETAQLHWKISGDLNATQFLVEHSTDGIYFKQIATVEGSEQAQFDFNHVSPSTGINYYRIAQLEKSGKQKYSPVRQVSFTKNTGLKVAVFPNPTREEVNVLTNLAANEKVQISLTNSVGQPVLLVDFSKNKTLNIKQLEKGVYFLKVNTETEMFSTTLVKM